MEGKDGRYCCKDTSEFLFSCPPPSRVDADESPALVLNLPSLICLLRCSLTTSERVQALRYLQLTRQLLSCSSDGGIAVWNMDTQREEVHAASLTSPPPPGVWAGS